MPRVQIGAQARNILVVASLSVGLLLAGCTGAPQREIPASTIKAASALTAFPPEIAIAQEISIQECIRSKTGLDVPFDSDAAQISPLTVGLSDLFDSAESARRLGYTTTISEDSNAIDKWKKSLSKADGDKYTEALLGPEDAERVQVTSGNGMVISSTKEGCVAEADAAVYGSVGAALEFNALVNDYLAAGSASGNERDARLSPIVPKFEECMKKSGYEVKQLGVAALAEKLFGKYRLPDQPPSDDEQRLAVADYECQTKVGMQKIVAEAFATESGDWLRANEGKLLAMQEELQRVKERAIEIING